MLSRTPAGVRRKARSSTPVQGRAGHDTAVRDAARHQLGIRGRPPMTVQGFRRIALGMIGAVEGAHMGHPDFRVNGRIFATLQTGR